MSRQREIDAREPVRAVYALFDAVFAYATPPDIAIFDYPRRMPLMPDVDIAACQRFSFVITFTRLMPLSLLPDIFAIFQADNILRPPRSY
jgi:hypothetical protein